MFGDIPLFPERASTHAGKVDMLFFALLGISGLFAALIASSLVAFAVKYRRRSAADRPPPIRSSLKLELAWSLIPLGITLFIFVWGARLFFESARPPQDALEIYVVVKLTMISQDVIHSFYVPAFRIHQDVLPNRYTTVWFEATKPGSYHLFCSQYCGTDHAKMIGEVIVMSEEEFAQWLERGADGSMAAEGRKLFQKLQCVTCHSADSGARAPNLEGLFGREVALSNGRRVRADDAYLRESILEPDAKIVAGFQPIMPTFKGQIDEEEMQQLLAFLRGLEPGQTPKRTEHADPPEQQRGEKR
jgi:cytochrome c oxidase subunit 2